MSGPLRERRGLPPGPQRWMLGSEEVMIVLEVGRGGGGGGMEKWSEGTGRNREDRHSNRVHPVFYRHGGDGSFSWSYEYGC